MAIEEIVKAVTDPTTIVAGGGALAALVFVMREFARRFSRDKVEVAKDRAETNIIEILQEQYNQALARVDKVEAERNDALAQMSDLRAKVAILESQLAILQEELQRLRESVKVYKNAAN